MKKENIKAVVKQICHPGRPLAGVYQLFGCLFKKGRCRITNFRPDNLFYNNRAFTLIELLVVVLIIGILAAVALPQYQKAVMRSRYNNLKTLTKNIANAQEVYYMENEKYADTFAELPIEMPSGKLDTSTDNRYYYSWGFCLTNKQITCQNNQIKMNYQQRLNTHTEPGTRICTAIGADVNSIQNQICKAETGLSNYTGHETGYFAYKYQD